MEKFFNHAKMFKKFTGTWKCDMGNNTIATLEINPFYEVFYCSFQAENGGKIVIDEKTLIGHNKNSDKLIETGIKNSSSDLGLYEMWFSSENKCEEILLEDIANPDQAKQRWTFELKSSEMLIWTHIVDNKPEEVFTFNRVK